MKKRLLIAILCAAAAATTHAEKVEPINFGNFDQWVTREIKESKLLGGANKTIYEIGPTQTITTGKPYTNLGGSPWATSNVLASPMGVTKTSNAVFPDVHGSGKCAKLTTLYEHCKVIGVVNMEVLVAGSVFLGKMLEPIKSTSNPYSKMEMGVPFTRRPKALQFDYKLFMPSTGNEFTVRVSAKRKHIRATTAPRCSLSFNAAGKMPTAISTPSVWARGANVMRRQPTGWLRTVFP